MRRMLLLLGVLALIVVGLWQSQGETAVRGKTSIQTFNQPPTEAQQIAQSVALADAEVRALTQGHRAELFTIRQMGQQTTEASADCRFISCQQVEIYNFDTNETITAVVDTERQRVLDVLRQPQLQPGINERLGQKAIDIAMTHPEVIEALGFEPTAVDMAPVATGIRGADCDERLCAGPTFRVGNEVLWAIVDLTDETLLALNWTTVPEDGRSQSAQGGIECPAPGTVDQMGWQLAYETTATDGFHVVDASFNGRSVLKSAKLVEWHVDYNGTYFHSGFLDVTGCGGGGGGYFIFPYGETQLLDLSENGEIVGFELVQDFRMNEWGEACNYRYEQRMQFYKDGRFRIVSGAYGRGCGLFAQYRPVVRIDLALDAQEQVGYWDGVRWETPQTELYLTPNKEVHGPAGYPLADNDALLWLMDQNGAGYYLQPGFGQFDDGGRGDEPFVYITQYNEAEGVLDLPVFGGLCCENDHQQGPHYFVDGEPVQNENVVLWYVAQQGGEPVQTDPPEYYCWTVSVEPVETYPCFTGPMFVPFGYNGSAITPGFDAPTEVSFPETAVFQNTSVVTGDIPVNFEWSFGDGRTAVESAPTHLYLQSGRFTPSLTVDGFANGRETMTGTAVEVSVENGYLPFLSR